MIKTIKRLYIPAILLVMASGLKAQIQTGSNFEYIKSEIQRGYDSLRIEGQKPFIISALYHQMTEVYASANRGVLESSNQIPLRQQVIFRMLIGDYNRTNIDMSLMTPEKRKSYTYIMNPPAYRTAWLTYSKSESEEAVRLQTWKTLDNLFKRAVGEYVKKQDGLKQSNFETSELSIPEWAKVPTFKKSFISEEHFAEFNKKEYETYAKELSSVFKNYPQLETGTVSLSANRGVERYFSTEGIEATSSNNLIEIRISASVKLKNGAIISDSYRNISPKTELPPINQMNEICKGLADRLTSAPDMEVFNDIYDGPVMFVGDAVIDIMLRNLATNSKRGFSSERKPLGSMSTGPDYFIGKQLYSKLLTVKDLAGTQTYKGKDLAGYYAVDEDGVIPPKELVLIDKGVLRNMLVGRMPLRYATESNGHSRMNMPLWGNLHMTVEGAKPFAKLKKKFISEGRKAGQEYVYIVNKVSGGNIQWMTRINTKTGEETAMRNALLEEIRPSTFKQILGASTEEYIVGTQASNSETREVEPVGYIVPQALILDNLQLLKAEPQTPVKEPLVPKPNKL